MPTKIFSSMSVEDYLHMSFGIVMNKLLGDEVLIMTNEEIIENFNANERVKDAFNNFCDVYRKHSIEGKFPTAPSSTADCTIARKALIDSFNSKS